MVEMACSTALKFHVASVPFSLFGYFMSMCGNAEQYHDNKMLRLLSKGRRCDLAYL